MGAFGLLGLSVLCPLLALPLYYCQRKISGNKGVHEVRALSLPSLLEIIIPAHNEAEHIGDTLSSIERSVQYLQIGPWTRLLPKITIRVGADGCTDNTAKIARQFSTVSVTESLENRSKWAMLKTLLADSSADWVILVDAGTVWPENWLYDFLRAMEAEPRAVGIAPSYYPLKSGWVAPIIWRVEAALKHLESFCGGPVSLHGATVGYNTASLKKALITLGDRQWLNDDIVIPLVLRALNPDSVIVYPVGQVQDTGALHDQLDFGRRKRMLMGNLQWTSALLPRCFRMNPVAGIVAVRRLFRILWAYWLTCIAAGLALAFHVVVLPAIAGFGILVALSGTFRQLAGAALVSLLTPFQMARSDGPLARSWK